MHLKDSVRHILAVVLMAGTLAGTVWTFSAGALSLSGIWESVISVGGIAAALEAGVIFAGSYLGKLDERIQSARKRDMRDELEARKKIVTRWFYLTAGISAGANLIFRSKQLDNFPLALFVSLAPIALIILFTIVLRPLPEDYAEIGGRKVGRALVRIAEQSGDDVLAILRRGRQRPLSDAELRQLEISAGFISAYAGTQEAHALGHVVSLAAPVAVVEADSAEPWLRAQDLMHLYGIGKRTAQARLAAVPGRRKVPNSNAWEAPQSAVFLAHGDPRNARGAVLPSADNVPAGAVLALTSANPTQSRARENGPAFL